MASNRQAGIRHIGQQNVWLAAAIALAALAHTRVAASQEPVVPDPARFERVRSLPGAHWDSVETKHFVLYSEPGTYAADNIVALSARAERAWADDLALIGVRDYPHRITIFYFQSKARMDSIFNVRGEGMTFPEAQLVMLVVTPRAPDDRHEIMHAVSINLWGWNAPQAVWQREGLANVASAPDWPYTIDQMAAQARRDGDARTAAGLTGARFLEGDIVNRFRAYMLAGSFVAYLMRTGGISRFRQLWQRGLDATPSIYGADLPTLGARWNAYLRTVPLPAGGINLVRVQQCACR